MLFYPCGKGGSTDIMGEPLLGSAGQAACRISSRSFRGTAFNLTVKPIKSRSFSKVAMLLNSPFSSWRCAVADACPFGELDLTIMLDAIADNRLYHRKLLLFQLMKFPKIRVF